MAKILLIQGANKSLLGIRVYFLGLDAALYLVKNKK